MEVDMAVAMPVQAILVDTTVVVAAAAVNTTKLQATVAVMEVVTMPAAVEVTAAVVVAVATSDDESPMKPLAGEILICVLGDKSVKHYVSREVIHQAGQLSPP